MLDALVTPTLEAVLTFQPNTFTESTDYLKDACNVQGHKSCENAATTPHGPQVVDPHATSGTSWATCAPGGAII